MQNNKAKKCNEGPAVWRAIRGCDGVPVKSRIEAGHFGRATRVRTCATCAAVIARGEGLFGEARQAYLLDLQSAAGVENYRTAHVIMVNGLPRVAR